MEVDAAGRGKVTRLAWGDLAVCLRLPPPRDEGKDLQKSAEVVLTELTTQQRTEPEVISPALFSVDLVQKPQGVPKPEILGRIREVEAGS